MLCCYEAKKNRNELARGMTKEDFLEWKQGSFTQKIYALLQNVRDDFKDDLANGATLTGNVFGSSESTAKVVGIIYGIDQLLEMEVN